MSMESSDQVLLTVEEAATYLNVDMRTVYRLISSNELKAVKVGRVYRIERQDLQDFISQSKIKVQQEKKKY